MWYVNIDWLHTTLNYVNRHTPYNNVANNIVSELSPLLECAVDLHVVSNDKLQQNFEDHAKLGLLGYSMYTQFQLLLYQICILPNSASKCEFSNQQYTVDTHFLLLRHTGAVRIP